jgi:topoisomerase-4 subunit A
MVYNMAYLDASSGYTMAKRFQVLAITRDREYDLTKGSKGSKCLYFSANPNGEAETVAVQLSQGSKAKIRNFDYDFAELDIKGRQSQGNILTKHSVKKIMLKSAGVSTLGMLHLWYDETVGRLNTDQRGRSLGNFTGTDHLLCITKNGQYELTSFELTNRYDPDTLVLLEKFQPDKVISVVYYEGEHKNYFVKRFKIETTTVGKSFGFIGEHKDSKLVIATTEAQPQVEIAFRKEKKMPEEVQLQDVDILVDVKGWKAMGNRLSPYLVQNVTLVDNITASDTANAEPDNAPQLGLW